MVTQVSRAVRVRRRFRRAFDDVGRRVVEGLEIVTTFRVLDGLAEASLPQSTAKSTLRLARPAVALGVQEGLQGG